ncbi:hypothetical protein PSAC2689_50436 [Paraburkholderia sacchari]
MPRTAITATPLFWIVLLAPLALVVLLSWRIERMSAAAAQMCFWTYAALVSLSLSGIFLVYTWPAWQPRCTSGHCSMYQQRTSIELVLNGEALVGC